MNDNTCVGVTLYTFHASNVYIGYQFNSSFGIDSWHISRCCNRYNYKLSFLICYKSFEACAYWLPLLSFRSKLSSYCCSFMSFISISVTSFPSLFYDNIYHPSLPTCLNKLILAIPSSFILEIHATLLFKNWDLFHRRFLSPCPKSWLNMIYVYINNV